jgi:hypothetical protein
VTFKEPRIHGMVYDPTSGEARFLDFEFEKIIKEIGPIYSLFDTLE